MQIYDFCRKPFTKNKKRYKRKTTRVKDATFNDIENLIKEIDKKYPYSTNRTDYGQLLREVAIRTKVRDIVKDIAAVDFGISEAPYLMSERKQLLYGYMNECVANAYEKGSMMSLDAFCEAWINIRDHENRNTIRERIEQIAKNRGLVVTKTIMDIKETFLEFEYNYNMLSRFSYGTNGYNQYLSLSKNGAEILIRYKFHPYGLPYGLGLGSNIFIEVERERKRREKEEKRERREERKKRRNRDRKRLNLQQIKLL